MSFLLALWCYYGVSGVFFVFLYSKSFKFGLSLYQVAELALLGRWNISELSV